MLSDSTPRQLLDAVGESGAELNSLAPAFSAPVTLPRAAVSASPEGIYATALPMARVGKHGRFQTLSHRQTALFITDGAADAGCWAVVVANSNGSPVGSAVVNVSLQREMATPVATAPFDLNRDVNVSTASGHGVIAEPMASFGTQVYLLSENASAQSCVWQLNSQCATGDSLIENCGFEAQHAIGLPDQWLLLMAGMSDSAPDARGGDADPFAAMNTDAAYTHSGHFSLRYTSSKPQASLLVNRGMSGLASNATYSLELFASAPTRSTAVSLLLMLNAGSTGGGTVLLTCPVGRNWTQCTVRFDTAAAAKPSVQLQMSSAGTVWIDDVTLIAECNHPSTPPTRSWPISDGNASARYWKFTVLDSWNADGTWAP